MLVTGADGFTGQHLVPQALLAGYEVHPLKSDLSNVDAIKSEVLSIQPEVVVHLAAISFVGHTDASAFYDVNVIGTLNLLDSLAALPVAPKKVLLASSANIYGNCEKSPILESQAPAPVNHYAMSKLAMEYMAKSYLDRLPIFFTRPFNYIGVGQADSFVIPKLVSHFKRKAKTVELGNIDVEREFNDVRFVCNAYLALLKTAKIGEVYNICSGRPMRLSSVIELLGQMTEHNLEVSVNPNFVRVNEVHRLCGSPEKLMDAIGDLNAYSLSDTLSWMIRYNDTK